MDQPVLHRMLAKLESRGPLDEADREAILSLSFRERTFEAGNYLVR